MDGGGGIMLQPGLGTGNLHPSIFFLILCLVCTMMLVINPPRERGWCVLSVVKEDREENNS